MGLKESYLREGIGQKLVLCYRRLSRAGRSIQSIIDTIESTNIPQADLLPDLVEPPTVDLKRCDTATSLSP